MNHKNSCSLWIADALLHCTTIFSLIFYDSIVNFIYYLMRLQRNEPLRNISKKEVLLTSVYIYTWKLWNVVSEKDHLDFACEKCRMKSQGTFNVQKKKRKKERRPIGLVISCVETAFWNALLKERSKGRVNEEEDINNYWMRLRKQVRHLKLREEALDRTVWGIRLGRAGGRVARRTTGWMIWMNEWVNEWMNVYLNVSLWQATVLVQQHGRCFLSILCVARHAHARLF